MINFAFIYYMQKENARFHYFNSKVSSGEAVWRSYLLIGGDIKSTSGGKFGCVFNCAVECNVYLGSHSHI